MAAQAALDAAQAAARATQFDAECMAVSLLKVSVLDEGAPEADWPRWWSAITDNLRTRPYFFAELNFANNIAALPVLNAAALAEDDLAALVAPTPQ